ncbi:MAG: hypothetical protein JKY49_08550 [Cohaesibacteraceae bacterium]|nr:hypothetical protein [Cohaesibacteraceae bacterium]MBL4876167.1 hypothetical protein [Cohaesibacteraceae bacterium]
MSDPNNEELELVELTPAQQKRRRNRNIAIAVTLGVLVVIFYAVTMLKIGANIVNRAM